jgi:hypothetical protein
VVGEDYSRILLAENPDLQSVVAFGGQEASPPQHGKVFIAVKPFAEKVTTASRKTQLKNKIIDRTPLAVDPVFIDPEYTFIIPNVTTYYDQTKTTDTTSEIEKGVRDAIAQFSTNNLERFGNRLRYSRFVRALDNLKKGVILNNEATITLEKRFVPNTNSAERVLLNYNNSIRPSTLSSTQFTFQGFASFLDDDGLGNVRIYRFNNEKKKTIVLEKTGSIDYTTGVVEINKFLPSSFVGIETKVSITPANLDVIPVREQILIMNSSDARITLIGETL